MSSYELDSIAPSDQASRLGIEEKHLPQHVENETKQPDMLEADEFKRGDMDVAARALQG